MDEIWIKSGKVSINEFGFFRLYLNCFKIEKRTQYGYNMTKKQSEWFCVAKLDSYTENSLSLIDCHRFARIALKMEKIESFA